MNNLFEKARKSELTPKVQHGVMIEYTKKFCTSTQALEVTGPTMYKELTKIASILKDSVHVGILKSVGCNFKLVFDNDESFLYAKKWIHQAIAYSRIVVDVDTLENGITKDTEYTLANTFAATYWLPMRADVTPKRIKIRENKVATYTVQTSNPTSVQLSFWEENEEQYEN